jgi:hypothetical protein
VAALSDRKYAWLWLLVAVQVAIPASYYLRSDRDDERFAWRMFSAVRVKSCEVKLRERRAGVFANADLERLLHASWRSSLARGRRRVIERFMQKRCTDASLEAVEFVRTCRAVDRKKEPPERLRLDCAGQTWSTEVAP